MPPTRLFVNDLDLSLYGLWCNLPLGWADAPGVTDTVTRVPGHAGGFLLGREAEIGPREVAVEGTMHAPAGDLRAKLDQVKRILGSPIIELRFAEWSDRHARARFKAAEVRLLPGLSPDYGAAVTLRFLLPNPYLIARSGDDVYTALAGTSVPLVLGTAPSAVRLVLIGTGSATPSVAYIDSQGVTQGRVAFDLTTAPVGLTTLATSEWIEFDGETMEMVRHTIAGVLSNVAPFLDTTDGAPFAAADPQDGDGTVGPRLMPSNCNLAVYYRKAWL